MGSKFGKILVVDDDADVLQAARLFLKQHLESVHTERDPARIPQLLLNESYDVILLDMNFTLDVTSGAEGFLWLGRILEINPAAVVIMITAFGDINLAVRAIKEGATDFVLKPWQNEKLLATVSSALNLHRSRSEVAHLRSRQRQLHDDLDHPFHEFIGISTPMRKVFAAIERVAKTDANVLILGENGTGKELVARAVHRNSARAAEVFISVDMGAITETLFESELFGHVKGAFTGASADRAGRFEVASGGTLFLDEIGNLPLTLQSKMLRAIETRSITRVGSNKPVPVEIRLICASNRSILEMVGRQEFRQDLLYRINTVEIQLPPLRERGEDLPLLADHFLRHYCRKYHKPVPQLGAATLKMFGRYAWPGNIRELRHSIERAVIMTDAATLQPSDFFFSPSDPGPDGLVLGSFKLEDIEKTIIRKVLDKNQGNISLAARELGITRASLYRRIGKHLI